MRIAVIALDTRGGVQPYAALSLGLQRAGHDVRLLAQDNFRDTLARRGLNVVPIGGSAEANVGDAAGVSEMSPIARTRFMREHTAAMISASARDMLDGCTGVELITGGVGGMVAGLPVAERLGVPFLQAHLQPLGPATTAFPGVLTPHVPRWTGPLGTRLSHRLTAAALRMPFALATQRVRTDVLGLPARPARGADPREALPSLYGYSRHILPAPPEWGPDHHVTGYWMLPAGDNWAPPAELRDFLASGPAPVCVGFGSMVGEDPAALSTLVIRAIREAGVRAVLLSGWGGLRRAAEDADDVIVLKEAPHDWLFPRCAAVVHHGGAGTTGAAFAAGIPSVVVPFGVDQPFWGARARALGVGVTPIPRRKLTASALAAALSETACNTALRERARDLGAHVRAEDGVANAVKVYDAVAGRLR